MILKKISYNSYCISARKGINTKCFPPAGNPKHRAAVQEAINAIKKCEQILAKKGVGIL